MLKKREKVLLVVNAIWVFGEGMLGPLFAVFSQRIGGDILTIAWAWALYLMLSGVGIVILGKVSDSFSKERMLVFSTFLNAGFTFAYLFVATPFHLLLVQVGLGIALAINVPAWNALYDQNSGSDNKNGLVWGIGVGSIYFFKGLGLIIGGLIVTIFSFSTLFVVMGCIQVFGALYITRMFRRSSRKKLRS